MRIKRSNHKLNKTLKFTSIILILILILALSYVFSRIINTSSPLIGCIIWMLLCIIISSGSLFVLYGSRKGQIKEYEEVKTYKVFNRMQICFYVSLLIGIGSYFAIALLSDTKDITSYFLEMLLYYGTLIVLVILGILLLQKINLKGSIMSLFIIGVLVALTFNILVSCGVIRIRWLYYLINAIGTSMMFTATILLHQLLSNVFDHVIQKNSKRMRLIDFRNILWAILISSTILEIVIVVFYFTKSKVPTTGSTLLFFPSIFLFVSLWIALMEPINKHYLKLLDNYVKGIEDEDEKEKVRINLTVKFAHTTRRVWVKIVCFFLRPFMRMKVINKKVVNTKNGPVIFVTNHYEIYGPIVSVLHLPFSVRIWIIHGMLSLDLIEEHIKPGTDKVLKFLPIKCRRKLVKRFSKIIVNAMHEFDPIPVYRESLRDLVKTMRESVDALMGGDNILIFPESTNKYKDGEVDKFFTGFAYLGEMYYRKTGKEVTFYPYYISKAKKTMTFGNGVTYNHKNDGFLEKQRIATDLHSEMIRLMDDGKEQK